MSDTPIAPPLDTREGLAPSREQLAHALFETEKPEIPALLAHLLIDGKTARPDSEQLLNALRAGLKRFRITA